MARKQGWWSVDFTVTLDGEDVLFSDLSEETQEHIIKLVSDGYQSGEVIEDMEDDEDEGQDESSICPDCGEQMQQFDHEDEDGNFNGWGWQCLNCGHVEKEEDN